jgi:hypothetical protein
VSLPNEPNRQPPFKPTTSLPNPYGDSAGYSPGYSPPSGYGGVYGAPGTPPGGPAQTGKGCLIAGIIGGVAGVIFLCCGGFLTFGYFVLEEQHKETARQLSVDYRTDAKVRQEVGEIQEVNYNWGATIAREDDGLDVYDVRGDKGTAQFVVDADDEEIYSVTLQNGRGEWDLPSGDEGNAPMLNDDNP